VQNETIRVPTLMLNAPDGALSNARGLYVLSLSTELEAKLAAETAYRSDAGAAVIVTTPSPLSRRAAAAFSDAWIKLGGTIKDTLEYGGNPVKIKRGVERLKGDVVFLAADAERARVIKPFLGRNTMVISTSQVYSVPPKAEGAVAVAAGRIEPLKLNDLNGLRFFDMPWLHQPDHTAVMVYPHATPQLSADLERLYALGIDAFRVAEQLARRRSQFELDGVTGRLAVHEGLIDRTPIEAEYRDGAPVPMDGAMLAHGAADTGSPGAGR
jgi:outer membrane PBP1 activator LpoA protein